MVKYNINFKEEIDIKLEFDIKEIKKEDIAKICLYFDNIFKAQYKTIFILEKKRKFFSKIYKKLINKCIETIKKNNTIFLSEYVEICNKGKKKFNIKNYSPEINNNIKMFIRIIIKEIFFIFDIINYKLSNKTFYDSFYKNYNLDINIQSITLSHMSKIYDMNIIYDNNKILKKYNFLSIELINYISNIIKEIYNNSFSEIEHNFNLFLYELLNFLCDYYYNKINNININSLYRRRWLCKYINHNNQILLVEDFFFNNLNDEEIFFQELSFNTFYNITKNIEEDISFKKNIIILLQIDFYYKCNSISFF